MPVLNSVFRHREFGDHLTSLVEYERAGGYLGLQGTLAMSPDDALYAFHRSGLRGRGAVGKALRQKCVGPAKG